MSPIVKFNNGVANRGNRPLPSTLHNTVQLCPPHDWRFLKWTGEKLIRSDNDSCNIATPHYAPLRCDILSIRARAKLKLVFKIHKGFGFLNTRIWWPWVVYVNS